MKRFFILAAIILSLTGCTCPDAARRVLSDMGFTNIHLTGYEVFGCSKDDGFHDGFTATGPTGKQVSGVVCSNWFSSHVRLD